MNLLAALASDASFAWLCKRRKDCPDHADVWDFLRDWPPERACLHSDLSAGRFRFGLLDRITKADGKKRSTSGLCVRTHRRQSGPPEKSWYNRREREGHADDRPIQPL